MGHDMKKLNGQENKQTRVRHINLTWFDNMSTSTTREQQKFHYEKKRVQ